MNSNWVKSIQPWKGYGDNVKILHCENVPTMSLYRNYFKKCFFGDSLLIFSFQSIFEYYVNIDNLFIHLFNFYDSNTYDSIHELKNAHTTGEPP